MEKYDRLAKKKKQLFQGSRFGRWSFMNAAEEGIWQTIKCWKETMTAQFTGKSGLRIENRAGQLVKYNWTVWTVYGGKDDRDRCNKII